MAGYGAVGRFAVAGWRRDFEVVSAAAGAALVLSGLSFVAGSGTRIEVVTSPLVLGAPAYLASAGARADAVLPSPLVLGAPAMSAEAGASAIIVPADLVLGAPAMSAEAGASAVLVPASLVLTAPAYLASAGFSQDLALPAPLVLGSVAIFAGSGTRVELVPSDLVLGTGPAADVQVGVAIDYVPWLYSTYRLSTIGAHAVAAGPSVYVRRYPRLGTLSFEALAGATAQMVPAELVLETVTYEVGARKKAVRGQFLIYS